MDYEEYKAFCENPDVQYHWIDYPEQREKALAKLEELRQEMKKKLPKASEIEKKDARWILPERIPRGQVTCLVGDGGTGKTFIWCTILAALSNNTLPKFMYPDFPFTLSDDDKERPFIMFSGEESTAIVLKRRLESAGANQDRIYSLGVEDERFQDVKLNSEYVEELISKYRPLMCVFDPIQSVIPENLRMAERNAMRSCTQSLIRIGEKYDCTFILVVHTNKRPGAWGRQRMADSSDLWDSSRSVLIAGETSEKGICYLSHEKSNYGKRCETVLYQIENGVVVNRGFTDKTDKDFVRESMQNTATTRAAPARDEAIKAIKEILKDGEMIVGDLDQSVRALGISAKSLRSAKERLRDAGAIVYRKKAEGHSNGVDWFISLKGQDAESSTKE